MVNKIRKNKQKANTLNRSNENGVPVKFKESEHGVVAGYDSERFGKGLRTICGTQDDEIAYEILLKTIAVIEPDNPNSANALNIACQSLHDQKPKDALEARLISQAVALYSQGMSYLSRAGKCERIDQGQYFSNMAVKMMRVHNETIETLNRHRRGGEQRVIVQHLADKMAVVNNFNTPGGVSPENKGASPCQQPVEQKLEPTAMNHVASPQWETDVAGYTAGKVPAHVQKKDVKE